MHQTSGSPCSVIRVIRTNRNFQTFLTENTETCKVVISSDTSENKCFNILLQPSSKSKTSVPPKRPYYLRICLYYNHKLHMNFGLLGTK